MSTTTTDRLFAVRRMVEADTWSWIFSDDDIMRFDTLDAALEYARGHKRGCDRWEVVRTDTHQRWTVNSLERRAHRG